MSAPPNWFIGFPVDDAWVADALDGVPSSLRTFFGEDIHITISFLGGCGETNAYLAWRALQRALAEADPPVTPLSLTLGTIELFGRKGAESYLSVVAKHPGGEVDAFLERYRNIGRTSAGLSPEHRPTAPHISIARTQRPSRQPLLGDAIAWARQKPSLDVPITLDEIALYTWTPARQAQLYYIVERAPLVHG